MKLLAVIALTMLVVLASAVRQEADLPREDSRIRIVAGPDRREPPLPAAVIQPAAPGSAPSAIPLPASDGTGASRVDADAILTLFNAQEPDPVWAPGAEATIRSRLPASHVRCAAFMCRIEMPVPAGKSDETADELARAASGRWPQDITCNPYTASIVGDPGSAKIVFYATRTAEPGEP